MVRVQRQKQRLHGCIVDEILDMKVSVPLQVLRIIRLICTIVLDL